MLAERSMYREAARRRRARRLALQRAAVLAALVVALAVVFGIAYAGSSSTLAEGTRIAGVDVGGLSSKDAVSRLEARAKALGGTPVTFTVAGERFRIPPDQLAVEADWAGAVSAARAESDGFRPLRGFRRLRTRFFGEDVAPAVAVSSAALEHKLAQIADRVDRPRVEPSLRVKGITVAITPGQAGVRLDREAAAEAVVRALSTFERGAPVRLPVETIVPTVTRSDLKPALAQTRKALSAPVTLVLGKSSWTISKQQIGRLLSLPRGGLTKVTIGGRGAETYLKKLAASVNREPRNATFAVKPGGIGIVPHEPGLTLDVPDTARALQDAMLAPRGERTAKLVVHTTPPGRTTKAAQAMGITGIVASYTTSYGGTPGRQHNVQLVARLIDDTLIAPGEVFSFNATSGERNADRGFQEAPVIINGELQNGIGGGVCQVSTTVFNAAFDAGLSIESRTNHALYISHYPLGRDATVDYPNLDLKFKNDTGRWLLLRTFVSSGSLTVNLYGTPTGRRVETETAPLTVTKEAPVEEIEDATLLEGKRVVEEPGAPERVTSVRRKVYDADGNLLYDSTWHSTYVAEPEVVRVGTKEKPKPEPLAPLPGVLPGGPVAIVPGVSAEGEGTEGAPTLPPSEPDPLP